MRAAVVAGGRAGRGALVDLAVAVVVEPVARFVDGARGAGGGAAAGGRGRLADDRAAVGADADPGRARLSERREAVEVDHAVAVVVEAVALLLGEREVAAGVEVVGGDDAGVVALPAAGAGAVDRDRLSHAHALGGAQVGRRDQAVLRAGALQLVDEAVAVVVLAVAHLGGLGPHGAGVVAADAARAVAGRAGGAARGLRGDVGVAGGRGVVAGDHVADPLAAGIDRRVGVAAVDRVGEVADVLAGAAVVGVDVVAGVAEAVVDDAVAVVVDAVAHLGRGA